MADEPTLLSDPPAKVQHPLNYGPSPPLRWRRLIRRVIGIILLLLLVSVGVRWGPFWGDRVARLYHQRTCLRYIAPPDQVVFDADPARVAQLAGDPNYVISGGCAFRRHPRDWDAVNAQWVPAGSGPTAAVVFLHELRAGGVSFLVIVERTSAAGQSALFIDGYDVSTKVIVPATITRPGLEVPHNYVIDVDDEIGPHTDIRIFAGQPDPADPSHFTIHYESGGKTHTEDGFMKADGTVEFH